MDFTLCQLPSSSLRKDCGVRDVSLFPLTLLSLACLSGKSLQDCCAGGLWSRAVSWSQEAALMEADLSSNVDGTTVLLCGLGKVPQPH
jgi:hypothetical protein